MQNFEEMRAAVNTKSFVKAMVGDLEKIGKKEGENI